MHPQITSPLTVREGGLLVPHFFANPNEFSFGLAPRIAQQPDWIQMTWFFTWLEWHLISRGQPVPKQLLKYAHEDVQQYVTTLRQTGIEPLLHNPYKAKIEGNSFLRRYKEGARYHGIKYSPQTWEEIHLEENNFGDIQYMIAATLERKKGRVSCPECQRLLPAKAISCRVEDYHGAGGRSFWCPANHPLFYTMDWIS